LLIGDQRQNETHEFVMKKYYNTDMNML